MGRKAVLFAVLAAILIVSPVLAIETEINVMTLPQHKVSIFILDPAQVYSLFNSYHIYSNAAGFALATYSGEQTEVEIRVQISKDGQQIMLEKLGTFATGSPLYLQIIPGNVSKNYKAGEEAESSLSTAENNETSGAGNESLNNESASMGNATDSHKEGLTGGIISKIKEWKWIPKKAYLIIGGIAAIAIVAILFFTKMFPHMPAAILKSAPKEKVYPLAASQIKKASLLEKELIEANKKLKESQKEIDKLKNKEKIQEIERRIEEEKKEIEKLKKGGSDFSFL